jgi:hypothetical protein
MIELKFTTNDPNLIELARMYWEFDPDTNAFKFPPAEIAYKLKCNISQMGKIISGYCTAYDKTLICSKCNKTNFVYKNRTDFTLRRDTWDRSKSPSGVCGECNKKRWEPVGENNKEKNVSDAQLRNKILRSFSKKPAICAPEDLRLLDAAFLFAYGRAGLEGGHHILLSLENLKRKGVRLTPLETITVTITSVLNRSKVLLIHPGNHINIFSDILSEKEWLVSPTRSNWIFPSSPQNPDTPGSLFKELEMRFARDDFPNSWKAQAYLAWKFLASLECLEYLIFIGNEYKLTIEPGGKTAAMFVKLLERYSVAQLYSFIWRATKETVEKCMRENTTIHHAINIIPSAIQRMVEKAEAEGWESVSYRRNFKLPQSLMSEVLYNEILKIGDRGFNEVPSNIWETD